MKILSKTANTTVIELNDGSQVLFSYQTPVAALVRENNTWHQYKTDMNWSKTTSRHINAFNPRGGAFGLKPQSYFDQLMGGL